MIYMEGSPQSIAVIDDEIEICEGVARFLNTHYFDTEYFTDPYGFLEALKTKKYDLVLLDIMMPKLDGLELCKELVQTYKIPVIFLTALSDTLDKILGLELGAHDYITKPFHPRELLARVKNALKKSTLAKDTNCMPATIVTKDWLISLSHKYLQYSNGKKVKFTPALFELFKFLYERENEVVSREEISQTLLGTEYASYDRALDVRVSRLRLLLNKSAVGSDYIQTVKGFGYILTLGKEAAGE